MIHMNFILFFKQMVSFMKSVDMYLLKTEGIAKGRISAKDSSIPEPPYRNIYDQLKL